MRGFWEVSGSFGGVSEVSESVDGVSDSVSAVGRVPSTGGKTSEDVDKASEAVGEISEPGFTRGVLGTTAETSETVACVIYALGGTFGCATLFVIWAMGAMAWEMDGRIAKIVGEIFVTVG